MQQAFQQRMDKVTVCHGVFLLLELWEDAAI